MRDILFGMAIGGILGMMLYKNNQCVQETFDKGEKLLKEELEHLDKPAKSKSK